METPYCFHSFYVKLKPFKNDKSLLEKNIKLQFHKVKKNNENKLKDKTKYWEKIFF